MTPGASENDETRATGGTARATTTETVHANDIGEALDAVGRESRTTLDALERNASAEITAAIDAARRGRRQDLASLLALLRRTKQSVMSSARRRARDEAAGRRESLVRQANSAERQTLHP